MKRAEALHPLSHDHQHGLYVALKLKRVDETAAADARRAFLEFWASEGRRHFHIEEDVLLPAYSRRVSADDDGIVRVLTQHVEIRRAAADLERDESPGVEALQRLGHQLEGHIRYEERELFPRIEGALAADELRELGAQLERAESPG